MKAVKGNREYTIVKSQQKHYQDAGFDIVEDGKVLAHGRGKTVSYDEYLKACEELSKLRRRVAVLEEENEALKAKAGAEKKAEKPNGSKAGE